MNTTIAQPYSRTAIPRILLSVVLLLALLVAASVKVLGGGWLLLICGIPYLLIFLLHAACHIMPIVRGPQSRPALDDQSFKFGTGVGEFPRDPLLTRKSAAIIPGEVNRLTVVASVSRFLFLPTGNRYTFFVNDQYVAQVEDNTIKYGDTGPAVELAKAGDAAAFEFDNFEVRAP